MPLSSSLVTKFKSKSRNTPFDGGNVKGKAVATVVGGEVKMREIG